MAEGFRVKVVIAVVLRYGVIAAFVIVTIGSALMFLEGGTGFAPLGTAEVLFGSRDTSLIGLGPLAQSLAAGKPYAIIDLGLIVLLATPVARVAISVLLFAEERRRAFVAITAAVLAILVLSMFVVAPRVS